MRLWLGALILMQTCGEGRPQQASPSPADTRRESPEAEPVPKREAAAEPTPDGTSTSPKAAETTGSPDAEDDRDLPAAAPPRIPERLGKPDAARMLRARDLPWGVVLVLAAEEARISVGAIDASSRVSIDVGFDDPRGLLDALADSEAMKRAPADRDDAGLAWFVPSTWTEPEDANRLAGLRCDKTDFRLENAPLLEVLTILGTIMGTEMRGTANGTTSLRFEGVRCHRVAARLLALSGTGAKRKAGALELTANPATTTPPPPLEPCTPPDRATHPYQPFTCLFLDEIRLGATATGGRHATAVVVPRSSRRSGTLSVRIGDRVQLASKETEPTVEYRVSNVAADALTLQLEDRPAAAAVVLSLGD
ncbi:MAG: hypothetical protein AAF721_40720 [Myxococcota bacterium]